MTPATISTIFPIDLHFKGVEGAIAAYLLPHSGGAALVECGPGSTLSALQAALQAHGYTVGNVSDVFLTHIHLDHAGAAGWLARQGARVHVHANGAAHLLNPEKLLASAQRIYGEMMGELWGDFLPVPPEQLNVLEDNATIECGNLRLRALDTPGHANHHLCYLVDGTCFTGDVGGVRMAGLPHVRLPTPPPEFHIETWRATLQRLRGEEIRRLAPTHFGFYSDVAWHFAAIERALNEIEAWMLALLPTQPTTDELHTKFIAWSSAAFLRDGLDERWLNVFEVGSPSTMSADGIARYWKKHRSTFNVER